MRFTNPQDFANPRKAIPVSWENRRRFRSVAAGPGERRHRRDEGIMLEMLACEERNPGSVFDGSFIERYCVGFELSSKNCVGPSGQKLRSAAD